MIDEFNFFALIPGISIGYLKQNQWTSLEHVLQQRTSYELLSPKQIAFIEQNMQNQIFAIKYWLGLSKDHYIFDITSNLYPFLLKQIYNPPKFLFAKGNLLNLYRNNVAIVGSRNPSATAIKHLKNIVINITKSGFVTVSGLAIGVDTLVHQNTLAAGGATIAVLPAGINKIYPQRNTQLAGQVSENGLLLSEFLLDTPAYKANFLQRNRIVTGLARTTIIMQASAKSGTLSSARHALEQNREVLVIPHGFDQEFSKGNFELIQSGAHCLASVTELIEILENQQKLFSF